MAERPRIDLFCEDRGHELFVRALVGRLAGEEGLRAILRVANGRGGQARALHEFKIWQRGILTQARTGIPNLLILVIDANCTGWNERHRQLEEAVDKTIVPRCAIGCPDPHLERWFLADPACFERVVGVSAGHDPGKCDRLVYKRVVEEAVTTAGTPLLTGTADLAPDLVAGMDFFRAGKNQPSLGKFVEELRGELRRIAG